MKVVAEAVASCLAEVFGIGSEFLECSRVRHGTWTRRSLARESGPFNIGWASYFDRHNHFSNHRMSWCSQSPLCCEGFRITSIQTLGAKKAYLTPGYLQTCAYFKAQAYKLRNMASDYEPTTRQIHSFYKIPQRFFIPLFPPSEFSALRHRISCSLRIFWTNSSPFRSTRCHCPLRKTFKDIHSTMKHMGYGSCQHISGADGAENLRRDRQTRRAVHGTLSTSLLHSRRPG